jgi:small subunit ribosomal protein S4
MGVAVSRAQARQMVRHNMVNVNSRRVNIPSFLIDAGDEIEIKVKDKVLNKIKENLELTKDRDVPKWLECNRQDLKAKIARLPEKEDIRFTIQEQLIVELYSK